MKENKKEMVYLLKVYDESGTLIQNVMPFRSEKGAKAVASEWVPAGRSFEIVAVELSD